MTAAKNKEAAEDAPARLSMDIKQIKSLIELMVNNDLSKIELREGDTHILLRRGQPVAPAAPAAVPVSVVVPAAAGTAQPATVTNGAPPAPPAEKEHLIRSPMVGTVYLAPEPGATPFVSVGSAVSPESVVCLIEAMKVYNEIKAEVAGRITKLLVKNAEAVEFDQPLFAVGPA